MYNNRSIGKAGKVSRALMHKLGQGDAFVFELDGDFLKSYVPAQAILKPLPKYQATTLDVSVMVPLVVTVAQLEKTIAASEPRIFDVRLQDTFKKDDWQDIKSITMRFCVRDETTTLDKDTIDAIYAKVVEDLAVHNGQVRA